jgi:hypothetical protein
MIGGGLGIIGPGSPVTTPDGVVRFSGSPHGVTASVAVGSELFGESAQVDLSLEDGRGEAVRLPPPDGSTNELLPLIFNQSVVFDEPEFPEQFRVPKGAIRNRMQLVMMFPAGLTLTPGLTYRWRITIDGVTRDEWTEEFYVPEFAAHDQ